MLREGFTYSHFARIAQMAFVDSAVKDFKSGTGTTSLESVCGLTGMTASQVQEVLSDQDRYEASEISGLPNPFARVLHGWHNDRDYVGPYRFPIDLPFDEGQRNFTALAARHAPGVSPHVILRELIRVGAVAEVGTNVWKPLKDQYIEANLTPENLKRMTTLVEALLTTLDHNTNKARTDSVLFERTLFVDKPLTKAQFDEFNSYLKVVGLQFLQRVDSFQSLDLHEKINVKEGDKPSINAGLQCFLFVEPAPSEARLQDQISSLPP